MSVLPPLIGEDEIIMVNGRSQPTFSTIIRNSQPGSVAGVPMLSVPSGTTPEGLSVGICLEGAFFADDHVLAVGEAIESLLGS